MSKNGTKRLKIASFGDIHLHHRHNPTAEILANLCRSFNNNASMADLDIIFINGDVFETYIQFGDPDINLIIGWVHSFLRLCVKYDIVLRVLEGTESHDWKQSMIFETQNSVAGIGADLKYVKDISIEYIERYGITVLYVPDEISPTTEITLARVRELLKAKGLKQVDFASMHGMFDFQLPKAALKSSPHHDSAAYLDIVRDTIFINHNHHFATLDRIIAPGSFDRTGFGYEEPKGHVVVDTDLNGNREVTFIENVMAKTFTTINCIGLTLEETIKKVHKTVEYYRDYSNVKIVAEENNPVFANMAELIRVYPTFRWERDVVKTDSKGEVLVLEEEDDLEYKPVQITRENIVSLLMPRVEAKAKRHEVIEVAARLLQGCL